MSKKIDYSHNIKIENNSCGISKPQEQLDWDVNIPKPVWRSPLTLAVSKWMSCIIGILSLLPLGKMIRSVTTNTKDIQISLLAFVVLFLLLMITLSVRRIANLQTRQMLICEFAINRDGKIKAIKEIHTEKCPKCGGKMKYCIKPIEWMYYKPEWSFSKQIEWEDILKVERQGAKQIPVLICKKNSDHYYVVYHRKNKKIEKIERKEAVIPDFLKKI